VRAEDRVLFVAALSRGHAHKGLDTVLEAMAALRQGRPDLRLDVVGSGNDLDRYRSRCRALGIDSIVRFRGRLSGLELAKAYRDATVLALPTSDDSFPIVLLEAMASGVPVVATRIGGIPELIDDLRTGLLIDPGNVGSLADSLAHLLDHPRIAARMGVAAWREAVRCHTWERQADVTNALFESVLHDRNVPGHASPWQRAG